MVTKDICISTESWQLCDQPAGWQEATMLRFSYTERLGLQFFAG